MILPVYSQDRYSCSSGSHSVQSCVEERNLFDLFFQKENNLFFAHADKVDGSTLDNHAFPSLGPPLRSINTRLLATTEDNQKIRDLTYLWVKIDALFLKIPEQCFNDPERIDFRVAITTVFETNPNGLFPCSSAPHT